MPARVRGFMRRGSKSHLTWSSSCMRQRRYSMLLVCSVGSLDRVSDPSFWSSFPPALSAFAGLRSWRRWCRTISKEDFMTLSDTQLLILSAASRRTDHAATVPANLKGSAAKKVIDRLLKEKLLQELHAKDDMPVWRRGADNSPYTLRITKDGLKAIEVEDFAEAPDNKATVRPNEVIAAKTAAET